MATVAPRAWTWPSPKASRLPAWVTVALASSQSPPRAAAGAEYGAAHDPARSFKFGLQRIIDGIEAFITEASR